MSDERKPSEEFSQTPARETLSEWSPRLIHKATSPLQCDVYEIAKDGQAFILKDCSPRPLLLRQFTRGILKRELRALALVSNVPGVPRAVGWLDADGLLIERVEAVKISSLKDRQIPLSFFITLARTVQEIHECGVAHGDISRSNVLIDKEDSPYVIDFATAWTRSSLLGRLLLRRVAFIDDLKVLRLRARYHADDLSEAEYLKVHRLPLDLKVGQFLKKRVYRPMKMKRWKGRARRLKGFLRPGRRTED